MLIYQLYIDKFSKNLQGLIEKLDYIKDLGADSIWILPHYPSPLVDDGYDVSEFKDVKTELGSLIDFKELLDTAHTKGLKIIIDLPINHTSTEHKWFKEARQSVDNPKRDYYIWSKSGADMLNAVNPFPNAKLSNWVFNPFTNDYYYATFYPLQPDLNWDNPQVLEEFFEIIDFWCDMGVDGIRLDALAHIIKRKHSLSLALPETHGIVKAIRKHIDSKYKNVLLIGEVDLPTTHASDYFGINKDECTTLFDFEGSIHLWEYIFERDPEILNLIKNNALGVKSSTEWIYFLGTHDALPINLLSENKQMELKKWIDPNNRYLTTHDKRPALRVAEIFDGKTDLIILAYKALMKIYGHKVIYYGDEIGMRNCKTDEFLIDNRHQVRGMFDWEEKQKQTQDNNSLLNRLKKVFSTRI